MFAMSLNEKKRNKQLSDIYLTEGISRSKSFAGLSHKRTNSDIKYSSGSDGTFDGSNFGHSSGSTKYLIRGFSSGRSCKHHKEPKPERTQIIFDAISKGLKDSIFLAQNDISSSRAAFDSISISSGLSQGRLYDLEKQMKTTERHLKRLEFHLSKLEELKEQYDVQLKMRDGIRTMAYAFMSLPGKEKDSALHGVRTGYKKCTEIMCAYENDLEALMGILVFEMKGIQGFARICAGDVFEVIIKHGDQKWKSRGHVMKNGQQIWDNKIILFKALFNEPLGIKAIEVRGLGKNLLLGNKYCDTRDLFSADPQQMTINLNPSGSLKLNLVITWNPLHNISDAVKLASCIPSSGQIPITYSHNYTSQTSITEDLSELTLSSKEEILHRALPSDETGNSFSSDSTSASLSAQSSAIASPDKDMVKACNDDSSLTDNGSLPYLSYSFVPFNSSTQTNSMSISQNLSITQSEDSSECCSIDMKSLSTHSYFGSQTLTETLKNLLSTLEDLLEHYSELNALFLSIEEIDNLLKEKKCSISDSNVSISIESALGCFDFLNSAIENDESENIDAKVTEEKNKIPSQNISSDTQSIADDNDQLNSCINVNPLHLTCGFEQLDIILTIHLLHCLKLISHLGSCGPLKMQEILTLKKLKRQQYCFSILLSLMKRNSVDISINEFFEEEETHLKNFWKSLFCDLPYTLCESFLSESARYLKSKANLESNKASLVATRLLCLILDNLPFNSEILVSVLQFKLYFKNNECNPDEVLSDLITDTQISEDIKSKDVQKILATLPLLSKISPSNHNFFQIAFLLIGDNAELKTIAENYLKEIIRIEHLKSKAISSYLEGLESDEISIRLGSCAAINILNALSCEEQLIYVAENDQSTNVREAAKNILLKLSQTSISESTT